MVSTAQCPVVFRDQQVSMCDEYTVWVIIKKKKAKINNGEMEQTEFRLKWEHSKQFNQ